MTQLIVGGVYLPQTSGDKYQCYPGELNVTVEMISGRTVIEQRGHVQMIVWSYDYMGNDLWRQLAAVLRSGKPFTVVYLPDDGDEMRTGTFIAESVTQPTFAFDKNGKGLWHNVGFTLREEAPHD